MYVVDLSPRTTRSKVVPYVSFSSDFSIDDIFAHLALTLSHIFINRCLENRLKVVRCRIDVLSTALVFTVFE